MGLRGGLIHFAFKARDVPELEGKRRELLEKGVKVSKVVDHTWCQSIYFKDPNGLQLEFCCLTEELAEAHLEARKGAEWNHWARG